MNSEPQPELASDPSSPPETGADPAPRPSSEATDSPLGELNLTVPAEWIAQLEAIAATTRRSLDEVGREAVARHLAITIGESAEVARLRSELAALKQQLTRLDAIDAILARLSRRQDALERSPQPDRQAAGQTARVSSDPRIATDANKAIAPNNPQTDAEDWGLFDDEPDEVLDDFLE